MASPLQALVRRALVKNRNSFSFESAQSASDLPSGSTWPPQIEDKNDQCSIKEVRTDYCSWPLKHYALPRHKRTPNAPLRRPRNLAMSVGAWSPIIAVLCPTSSTSRPRLCCWRSAPMICGNCQWLPCGRPGPYTLRRDCRKCLKI